MSGLDTIGDGNSDLRKTKRQRQPDLQTLDRLPPHSIEAEQGVLGCCLLSPGESIGTCIDKFQSGSEDFYDLRHRHIFELLVAMYDAREGIDLLTVQQRLKDRNQLEAVGGLAYLSSLPDAVPSAANLTYYTDIVAEKSRLRRMIKTCTGLVVRAYEQEGDADHVIEEAASEILKISQSNGHHAGLSTQQLVQRAIATIEDFHARNGALTGLATGFVDFDKMTSGLHGGEMTVIAARPSMGKAQPVSATVLTSSGFVPIGELQIGNEVIGLDGRSHTVIGIYPQGTKQTFRVKLSDGTSTRCCAEHLWSTQTRNERRRGSGFSVKTTAEIIATIHGRDGGRRNHAVPLHEPIENPGNNVLPLHPWLLGALLGDGKLHGGNICFHKPEQDLQARIRQCLPSEDDCTEIKGGLRIRRKKRNNLKSHTATVLEELGIRVYSENKFIPESYMSGSIYQRLQLLMGLLDTDGYVCGSSVEFSSSSERLSGQVVILARSLGYVVSKSKSRIPRYSYKGSHKDGLRSWRFHIHLRSGIALPVSSMKHLARVRITSRKFHRSIVSIESDIAEECVCIRVAATDSLYLTDDFIPTHNTSLAMNIAEHIAVDLRLPVGVFSLEMTADALMLRMLCCRARVNLRNIRDGFLAERDFPKLTHAAGKILNAPLIIDDTPRLSIIQLRAKARRMAQQHAIKLFVVDYMQLLQSSERRRSDNRQQEISDISAGVKALAKELQVPVLVLSQLNRNVEREKRRPQLSDLRESGSIEQDADLVGLLYRPDESEEDGYGHGGDCIPINLMIAKQRNGPTGDVALTFLKTYTRFESAARVGDGEQ